MTRDGKDYLIAALWLTCGNLTWVLAAYLFGSGTSYLIFPIARLVRIAVHLRVREAFIAFTVYTISDVILTFLIAFLLSRATGKRNIWLFMFIVGAVGWPLYHTIRNHIAFYHENLPVWDTLIPSITVHLIITPLVVWFAFTLGNQYRLRKKGTSGTGEV